jgi:hypothetical protein
MYIYNKYQTLSEAHDNASKYRMSERGLNIAIHSHRHTGRINIVKLGIAKNDHVIMTYRSSTCMDALMPERGLSVKKLTSINL